MTKSAILKQKQVGIVLIILGVSLFLFIILFVYFKVVRITGFPELLPTKETVAFIEMPASLDADIVRRINEAMNLSWDSDIAPWVGERVALAFLSNEQKEKLLPLALLQVRAQPQAFEFLKKYQNQSGQVSERILEGTTVYETSALHFAFLSDILVISPSAKGLEAFMEYQGTFAKNLGTDERFARIRQNMKGSYFLYLTPQTLPKPAYGFISTLVPQMPTLTLKLPAVGISAEKNENAWQGSSYGLLPNTLTMETEQTYRANLLPLLPPDMDMLLSGQDVEGQLTKLSALVADAPDLAKPFDLLALIQRDYLPDVNLRESLQALAPREFAFTAYGEKVLFASETADLPADDVNAVRQQLHEAFKKIAGQFTPAEREVTLRDSTKAAELIPDSSQVQAYEENFQGIPIRGFTLGKDIGIYDATTSGKWFVSNDLPTLKKSLLLTKEPGLHFRDTPRYRQSLQPILKNPELLGISVLPGGVFSFSKRTMEDHMETNFVFVIQ